MLTTIPIYAGLLGLLYIVLSGRVIGGRGKYRLGVGDGGNPDMVLRMRAHGNFAEYTPLALVLIAMLELSAVPALAIHGLGACLLVGRLLHAWGLSRSEGTSVGRFAGMILTFAAIIVPSVWLLVIAAG